VNEDELDDYELESLRAGERKDLLNDDVLICECLCVSVADIRKFFNKNQNVDLEALRKEFHLGAGCSSCVRSFSQWKDQIF
jgi:NAD(P)H-nitrite reductase large subunit